jgi:hypothetical protein
VWTGIAAIVLWILGLVVMNGMSDSISDKATDQQILAWVDGNTNTILLGGWLFMVGCLCFVWFAAVLRSRLHAAEGAGGMLTTLAFAGALATAIFGMAIPAGDVDAAINKSDISATTAGTLHHLGDLFFVGAELFAILMLAAVAVHAFRTAALPRWWAIAGAVLAVVLVIGPIGWIGLLFGLPLWTLGTTILLVRPGARTAPAVSPAT